jgi:hypothetical protein
MGKYSDWEDELEDDFGEMDGEISYWSEEYIERPYGLTPEQSDSYIPVDKQVLRMERHNRKLRRQEKENRR